MDTVITTLVCTSIAFIFGVIFGDYNSEKTKKEQ